MKPFDRIPRFEALTSETIPQLGNEHLAAACCVALDLLNESCPGGTIGMLELLDPEDAERLRDVLWDVHLAPRVSRVPETDAWPEASAPEIEECAAALVRELFSRDEKSPGEAMKALCGLGDHVALDISTAIEDWQQGEPAPA